MVACIYGGGHEEPDGGLGIRRKYEGNICVV